MKTKAIRTVVEKVDEMKSKGRYVVFEYNDEILELDLNEAKKFLVDKKVIDGIEYVPEYFVIEIEEEEIKIPRKDIEEIVSEELMNKRCRIKKTAKVTGAVISGVGVVAASIAAVALAFKKKK